MGKPEWCPTMSGNFTGYKPQWKHRNEDGAAINKRLFDPENKGKDWTAVQFVILRGVPHLTVNGHQLAVGVPFPAWGGGILESLGLVGHEQALAMAYHFAAHVASLGGEVEVRAQTHEVVYDLKARPASSP